MPNSKNTLCVSVLKYNYFHYYYKLSTTKNELISGALNGESSVVCSVARGCQRILRSNNPIRELCAV